MADKHTDRDAAKETDSGGKEIGRAWHQARDDARESGEIPKPEDKSEPTKESKEDDKK